MGATLLGTSCVKDELFKTSHPAQGAVKITVDWSKRSSESRLPGEYTLRIIGQGEVNVTESATVYPSLFEPGKYELLAFNSPSGFEIKGNTATVFTLASGTMLPVPGYLFSGQHQLYVQKYDTLQVTVGMRQLVRQLTFVLKLEPGEENRLKKLEATLEGIIPSVNLLSGETEAVTGGRLNMIFEPTDPPTDDKGKTMYATTLRILGGMPFERQLLTVQMTLNDSYKDRVVTDLSDIMKNFAASREPLVLEADLGLPISLGVSGSINDWKPGLPEGNGEVSAE